MTGWKEICRGIGRKPAEWMFRKCPRRLRVKLTERVRRQLEGQYAESGQQTEQRAEEFLIKEGILIFWGMTLLAVMLVSPRSLSVFGTVLSHL